MIPILDVNEPYIYAYRFKEDIINATHFMKIIIALFLLSVSVSLFSCTSGATDPDPSTFVWNQLHQGTLLTFFDSYTDSTAQKVDLNSSMYTLEIGDLVQSFFGKNNVRQYLDTTHQIPRYLAYDSTGDFLLLGSDYVNGVFTPRQWILFPVKSKDTITLPPDTIAALDNNEVVLTTISYDGTENITVANHSFACVRLKKTFESFKVTPAHQRTEGGLLYYWYAPEIGYFVKQTTNDTSFTVAGVISQRYYGSSDLLSYEIK